MWTFGVSNDLRACSCSLVLMAERTPVVRKYRDAIEAVISATMEIVAPFNSTTVSKSENSARSSSKRSADDQPQDQQRVQSRPRLGSGTLTPIDTRSYPGPTLVGEASKEPSVQSMSRNEVFTPDYSLWQANQFFAQATPYRQPQSEFELPPPKFNGPSLLPGNSPNDEQPVDMEWLFSLCEGGELSLEMLQQMTSIE